MEKTMLKVVLAGVTVASLCVSTTIFAQGGGNGQGGTGGGNAHGAATAGMTHWGDPVDTPKNAMSGKMRNQGMENNNAGMDSMSPNNAAGASKNGQ
jgi:hypothetical protein